MHEPELRACYRVLELPPSATLAEVREAYRMLSRVWHPDRFAGNPDLIAKANARQQELNTAYQTLVTAYTRGTAPLHDAPDAATRQAQSARNAGPSAAHTTAASQPDANVATQPRFRAVLGRRRLLVLAGGAALFATLSFVLFAWLRAGASIRDSDGGVLRAIAVAAGGGHACAAATDAVACWGRNDSGQRGGADRRATMRAQPLALDDSVAAVATGISHSCALRRDGNVYCWGANYTGQLGDRSLQDRDVPVAVPLPEPAASISVTAHHSCAVTRRGALYCWGNDTDGQLGVGAAVASCRWDELRFFCSDRPERIGRETTWRSVAAGGSHTCALAADGSVYCWGSNRAAQLGSSTLESCRGPGGAQPCRRSPARLPLDATLQAITAGASHTCALDGSGRALCWGSNQFGQAGAGDAATVPTPAALATGFRFTTIAAGAYHTCATNEAGALYCWGRDHYGELRGQARELCDGIPCARRPVRLMRRGVVDVAAGFGLTCIRRASGNITCWGDGDPGEAPAPRPGPAARSGGRLFAEMKWRVAAIKRFLVRHVILPLERL